MSTQIPATEKANEEEFNQIITNYDESAPNDEKISESPVKSETAEMIQKERPKRKALKNRASNNRNLKKKNSTVFTRFDTLSKLERYDLYDKNNIQNTPFVGDEKFMGPVDHRKKTNILWLILFIVLNVAFILNTGFGIKIYICIYFLVINEGSSDRLMNGMDFRGEICGVGKLKSRPYLYYLAPTVDLNVKMCVTKCPESTGQEICLYDTDVTKTTTFCYMQIKSKSLGKYCLPQEPFNKIAVDNHLSSVSHTIKRFSGDLGSTYDIIIVGCFLSILMGYIFQRCMKNEKVIRYLVWICVWGTIFCILAIAFACYDEFRRTIKFRCLFGIDKHNCGGIRAKGFYVKMKYFYFFLRFLPLFVLE